MNIDEAKETIAFQQWREKTWSSVGIMQGTMMHSAWLARAAQPARVSREAVCAALVAQGWDVPEDVDDQHALDCFCNAIRALNIEVDK